MNTAQLFGLWQKPWWATSIWVLAVFAGTAISAALLGLFSLQKNSNGLLNTLFEPVASSLGCPGLGYLIFNMFISHLVTIALVITLFWVIYYYSGTVTTTQWLIWTSGILMLIVILATLLTGNLLSAVLFLITEAFMVYGGSIQNRVAILNVNNPSYIN